MSIYKVPAEEMHFLLFDVFNAETTWKNIEALNHITKDLAVSVIEEAAKIIERDVAPFNRETDEEGVHFDNGQVTVPAEFKKMFDILAEGGWTGLGGNPDFGGQGIPKMLTMTFDEMLNAGSASFCLYVALTAGACVSIDAHASQELKDRYLPQLYSGKWSASMCLTESQSGTDLGLNRTKATPLDNGCYEVSGTKIFITSGDHDMTENIIHLVLAKLPDAPNGSKGVSLFIVPKFKVNANGELAGSNGVTCGSVEHKMGIHASATCVMNFDGAEGYLIGQPHQGLKYMFTMMNYERLYVGVQGLALADRSYQNAVEYAKDRIQGRSLSGVKSPDKAADSIIEHGDVKRMLLLQKVIVEGSRAFAVYVGEALDKEKYLEGEDKNQARNKVALLTPVVKAFLTDLGLESVVAGQQVFGGHGYIREWGQEQFVRDMRIAQIYEGTNGIQAMDFLGRKVIANRCAALNEQIQEIRGFLKEHQSNSNIASYIPAMNEGLLGLESVFEKIMSLSKEDSEIIGTSAVDCLHLFGYNMFAYMWLKMLVGLKDRNDDFAKSKLYSAGFYFSRVYPRVESLLCTTVEPASFMSMDADLF
jgi:alkylation response protein AidB-like acyl-CoA dehydrogenase